MLRAVLLIAVVVLILQQVLVVYFAHVEIAKLAVRVIRPVGVVLCLLRVELSVHLGVLVRWKGGLDGAVKMTGLRRLRMSGLRREVVRRRVLGVRVCVLCGMYICVYVGVSEGRGGKHRGVVGLGRRHDHTTKYTKHIYIHTIHTILHT